MFLLHKILMRFQSGKLSWYPPFTMGEGIRETVFGGAKIKKKS
jgi:hypothetical protein